MPFTDDFRQVSENVESLVEGDFNVPDRFPKFSENYQGMLNWKVPTTY